MDEAIYTDGFQTGFSDELDFIQFLKEREQNGSWFTSNTKGIYFHGLNKESPMTDFLKEEYADNGIGVVSDTLKNTALAVEIDGAFYPVRRSAIKTILERANISGPALRKVSKPVLARILNDCMQVQKGLSLIRYSEEKISAMHSGDNSYAILEIPELFQITSNWLEKNFPGYEFMGGVYEHSCATGLWEIGDFDNLIKTYTDFLDKHGIAHECIKPALRLITSDVGICGANLYPMLFVGSESKVISLGHPIKTTHRNGASMEEFEQKLNGIFAQYSVAIGKLSDLAFVEISHPLNCMGNVMKKIRVPKKMGMEAMDRFLAINGNAPCTAHDIYFGICHVIFLAQCESGSGFRVADMEENVARALTMRWRDYDMPGEFNW